MKFRLENKSWSRLGSIHSDALSVSHCDHVRNWQIAGAMHFVLVCICTFNVFVIVIVIFNVCICTFNFTLMFCASTFICTCMFRCCTCMINMWEPATAGKSRKAKKRNSDSPGAKWHSSFRDIWFICPKT